MSANVFRAEAKSLGFTVPAARHLGDLEESLQRYLTCVKAVQECACRSMRMNDLSARLIANAVLTGGNRLSAVSYICVADYISRTRWPAQRPTLSITPNEQFMFDRAKMLQKRLAECGVTLEWRLVLADAWGLWLFRDRCDEQAIEEYCRFMEQECAVRDIQALRWTQMVASRQDVFDSAAERIRSQAVEKAAWEASVGEEIGQTKGVRGDIGVAQRHIEMRAAEAEVVVDLFGPTVILSTEDRGDRRYDHLLVDESRYPAIDFMPYAPQKF